MPIDAAVSETTTQFNWGWAEANPALFTQRLREFYATYPQSEWDLSVSTGLAGFLDVTAKRKPVTERT